MKSNFESDNLTRIIIQTINEKKPQNVEQLVAFVKEELGAEEEKILAAVAKLQSQGKIKLVSLTLPTGLKLATYIKTGSAFWYWVTIATATITVAVVFTVPEGFYPWIYLRNALGIAFVLWFPGYAFINALFPVQVPIKTPTETLDNIERIALSIGLSLALVPIVGLALYYSPLGISLLSTVLSLFTLTAVFATVALIRAYLFRKGSANRGA